MDRKELVNKIKKIRSDLNLSEKEKSMQIQLLVGGDLNLSKKKTNICEHYTKLCSNFYFECCKVFDSCKRCHTFNNTCVKPFISKITCVKCNQEQEPSNICKNCKIKFSESWCNLCQIWTEKEIHHCEKCGICRIGSESTLFHCEICEICFDTSTNNTHKCVNLSINTKSKFKDLCGVCGENVFDSQLTTFILDCSHPIHTKCYTKCIETGFLKCPCCKKSFGGLETHWNWIRSQIKLNPLPNDFIPICTNDIVDTSWGKFIIGDIKEINNIKMYKGKFIKNNMNGTLNEFSVKKNLYKSICCNDCGAKTLSQYHPYGLECSNCSSFNTQE